MKQFNNVQSGRTCVLIVTYGNRFPFLQQVVNAAFANSVHKIVIVDNGSANESRQAIQKLKLDSNGRLDVLMLPENLGSAGGFKAGLEYLLACSDCEYIWLLDDDNRPDKRALEELLNCYGKLRYMFEADRLVLASVREDWEIYKKLIRGVPPNRVFPRRSSFMGFHVLDQPRKFLEFFHLDREVNKQVLTEFPIEIPCAPYGGLFFHKSVVWSFGYPDERFFLYNDDTDYTYRMVQKGCKLFLVPSSVVFDLGRAWHLPIKGETLFSRLLIADSDFRIYYGTRNQSYLDRHLWRDSPLTYALNKWAFFLLLSLFALMYGRWKRFFMIARAVRRGERKDLGHVKDFENP